MSSRRGVAILAGAAAFVLTSAALGLAAFAFFAVQASRLPAAPAQTPPGDQVSVRPTATATIEPTPDATATLVHPTPVPTSAALARLPDEAILDELETAFLRDPFFVDHMQLLVELAPRAEGYAAPIDRARAHLLIGFAEGWLGAEQGATEKDEHVAEAQAIFLSLLPEMQSPPERALLSAYLYLAFLAGGEYEQAEAYLDLFMAVELPAAIEGKEHTAVLDSYRFFSFIYNFGVQEELLASAEDKLLALAQAAINEPLPEAQIIGYLRMMSDIYFRRSAYEFSAVYLHKLTDLEPTLENYLDLAFTYGAAGNSICVYFAYQQALQIEAGAFDESTRFSVEQFMHEMNQEYRNSVPACQRP